MVFSEDVADQIFVAKIMAKKLKLGAKIREEITLKRCAGKNSIPRLIFGLNRQIVVCGQYHPFHRVHGHGGLG